MKLRNISWQSKSLSPSRVGAILGAALLLVISATRVTAFSLLGPAEPWMVPPLGYAQPGDIGGPMDLGQEYRWNVPVLTYAFDSSFVDYFGSNGIAAVESAISILNGLPPVSQADPTTFPLAPSAVNYAAQAQGLFDLKSQTLALLLEQLGLATPTRFTFCVHDFVVQDGVPAATVIQRNYDPYSWSPSAQVNGVLYSYYLAFSGGSPPTGADALEYPVDPGSSCPAVADDALTAGFLYTNLTRDDVAGLRYLIHTNNRNFETLLPGVHGAGTNADSYVDYALRPGVDKIVFVRPDNYNSLLGRFATPWTNQFIDAYVSHSVVYRQQLERVTTQPDFLFTAADLSNGAGPTPLFTRTGTTNWLSFAQFPGASGPGVIRPNVRITFGQSGFYLQTADSPSYRTVIIQDFQDCQWGSFDASATLPTAYPVGSVPATNQLAVQLELDSSALAAPAFYTWQLPVPLGSQADIQTSTNLTDWTPLLSIINHGRPLLWRHSASHPQRYFRLVSQ